MYLRTAFKYKPPEGLVIIIWRFLLLEFMGLVILGGYKKPKGKYAEFYGWVGIKRWRIRVINTQLGLDVLLIGLNIGTFYVHELF